MAIRHLKCKDAKKIGAFFNTLIKNGKRQHFEAIKSRCLVLQNNFEEQTDVLVIKKSYPPLYSVWISGTLLKGFEPNEGYTVYFTASETSIILLEIR